jgi:hypothetical protein
VPPITLKIFYILSCEKNLISAVLAFSI